MIIKPATGWIVCKKTSRSTKVASGIYLYKRHARDESIDRNSWCEEGVSYFVRKAELRVIEDESP